MAITYTLKHPVTAGEKTFTEVVLQRPKMKDFIACKGLTVGEAATDAALISSLSAIPEIVVSQFDIDDCAKLRYLVSRIWNAFFDAVDGYSEKTLEEIEAEAKAKAEVEKEKGDPQTETAESA
jgi:hypothetical protein